MQLFARHDSDSADERHYQVPRPSDTSGIRNALRDTFKPANVPPDLARLLSRLN